MSDDKELNFAGFAAMFRLGPEKITMTKADAVRLVELMQRSSAEITRLRAERDAARREGMEELERHFINAAAGTPLGHEDHQRGASTYNWLIYCATTISAIKGRAAAGEVK